MNSQCSTSVELKYLKEFELVAVVEEAIDVSLEVMLDTDIQAKLPKENGLMKRGTNLILSHIQV